jgi:hypothetical protein
MGDSLSWKDHQVPLIDTHGGPLHLDAGALSVLDDDSQIIDQDARTAGDLDQDSAGWSGRIANQQTIL